MNKRAELGDQLYIVYFIFILIIITVGIVFGSQSAFGKPHDSRKVDAELLLHSVTECLSIPRSSLEVAELFETCKFDSKHFEKGLILHISAGNKELFKYGDHIICRLQDRYPNGPRCIEEIVNLKIDSTDMEVNILAGSSIK